MANARDTSRRPDPALLDQVSETLLESADVRTATASIALDDAGRGLVARLVDSALNDFRTPEAGMAALAWLVASYATSAHEHSTQGRRGGKTLVYLWPRVPANPAVESDDPGQLSLDLEGRRRA
jgi:hypothetical protein